VQVGPDGGIAAAQHASDLRGRPALQVIERHGLGLTARQATHRSPEVGRLLRLLGLVGVGAQQVLREGLAKGADRAIHPHLAVDEEAAGLLARARELNDHHGLGIPAWRIGLAVLARRMPPDEVYDWLERLKVRRRDAERIAAAVTLGARIVERLENAAPSPAEVVALSEPFAPDAPLFALALADLEPLHEYFGRLGGIRLEITGADVADLGLGESPRVGEILGELRRRKLNGELDGRESELAAARELIESS